MSAFRKKTDFFFNWRKIGSYIVLVSATHEWHRYCAIHANMNQPQVCICPLLPESASHLLPHPIPLGCHRALD